MEARAYVRSISMSPRKMRVVANMVRGEQVTDALNTLAVMPKKAARLIEKALKSAAANADDKSGGEVDIEKLTISKIYVDGGPMLKRFMPRAMGRATSIHHRTSHLTVVLSDEEN